MSTSWRWRRTAPSLPSAAARAIAARASSPRSSGTAPSLRQSRRSTPRFSVTATTTCAARNCSPLGRPSSSATPSTAGRRGSKCRARCSQFRYGAGATEANDPTHRFGLRTDLDLPRNVEVSLFLRSIGELPSPHVPAYTELNGRVGWRATPHFELSFAAQDLFHDHHPEFGAVAPRRVEFERSVRVLAVFRY